MLYYNIDILDPMETLQTAPMTNSDDAGEATTTTAQRSNMMTRSVSITTENNNNNYKPNRTTTSPVNSSYMAIDSLDEIDNSNHQYDRKNESNRISQQPQSQAVVKKTYFSSFV